DVQDKTLLDATFKHKMFNGHTYEYDAIIQAERANLRFDLKAMVIHAVLEKAEMQRLTRDSAVNSLATGDAIKMSFPFPSRLRSNQVSALSVIAFGDVRFTQIRDQFLSLAYAPESKLIGTSAFDGSIALWNTVENKKIGELKVGTLVARTVKFAPNGLT